MPIIDAPAVIKKIYLGGKGGVPYPTFMLCFNALLESASPPKPKKPTPELKEKFEACCMAINVGIEDTQDRHRDREREFYRVLWPVWEQFCKEAEVARFERLVDGKVRRQVQAEKAAYDKEREARQPKQEVDPEEELRELARLQAEKKKLFAQAEASVKRKEERKAARAQKAGQKGEEAQEGEGAEEDLLGLGAGAPGPGPVEGLTGPPPQGPGAEPPAVEVPAEPEEEVPAEAENEAAEATPPPVPQEQQAPQMTDEIIEMNLAGSQEIEVVPDAPMCANIAELIKLINTEELPVHFSRQSDPKPYAFYKYRDQVVEVKLVEANNAWYLLMGYPVGHGNDPAVAQHLKEAMDELHYKPTSRFAYEKVRGQNKHKVRIGSKSAHVGHKRARKFSKESLVGSLNDLHMILTSILDRIEHVASRKDDA